jgi:hypothetical protein
MTAQIATKETFFHDDDGEASGRNVEEYMGEQLISTTTFDPDGTCKSRIDYGYDDRGNNISRLWRRGATRQVCVLLFDFDEQGREVGYREYDRANKLVRSYVYEFISPKRAIQRVFAADGSLDSEQEMEWVGGAFFEPERLEQWRSKEREGAGEPGGESTE